VIALERIRKLKRMAEEHIEAFGFISNGVVKVYEKNALLGLKREAPFDKIVSAAAGDEVPQIWKDELRVGGRMVIPVKNSIKVLDKISPSEFKESEYFGFSFVPLVKDF
jgi:protein-L-isoaspartate(D-aspartate) O-methyltransferase